MKLKELEEHLTSWSLINSENQLICNKLEISIQTQLFSPETYPKELTLWTLTSHPLATNLSISEPSYHNRTRW